MKYESGEDFLNKLYTDMHMSDVVMHTATKSDTPTKKIGRYMQRLEKVHDIASTNQYKLTLLKKFYYDKHVIKELPESYVNLQIRIAREDGMSDLHPSRKRMLEHVQKEQQQSLDSWIDYFTSDNFYPMWFKNYAFQGMLKLGKYNKEKGKFEKRAKTTVEPYLVLDKEILKRVYDTISNEIGTNMLTDSVGKKLVKGESFAKLYAYYLREDLLKNLDSETDGIWIKYNQGKEYKTLWKSLQGKCTDWCTAGIETCKKQLEEGDFYVFYTKDKEGNYKNPRVAIRMKGKSQIAEVRGIALNQNLESHLIEIVDKKLDEFSDKKRYKKKVHDMRLLTEIEMKVEKKIELSIEELKFLYEVEDRIDGFGQKKDPRIAEIIKKRNAKKDLATIYHCKESQIATELSDFSKDDILFYLGDLQFEGKEIPKEFSHLRRVFGNVSLPNVTSCKELSSLEVVEGNFSIPLVRSSAGLESLRLINGNAEFDSLVNASSLSHLSYIEANAIFKSLKSSQGLNSLMKIGSSAIFPLLEDATALDHLTYIGGYADFLSLQNSKGLSSLIYIGGDALFQSLTDASSLINLIEICGSANFYSLKDATGLENLEYIKRLAHFNSLLDERPLLRCNKYEEIKKYVKIAQKREETLQRNLEIAKRSGFFERDLDNDSDYTKEETVLKKITLLDLKNRMNMDFSKEDLKFIYGIDHRMNSDRFAARIDSIKNQRDKKKDLATIYNCREEQVATSLDDFNHHDIIVYLGNLEYNGRELPKTFSSLKMVEGNIDAPKLETSNNLNNLEHVNGVCYLNSLKEVSHLSKVKYMRNGEFSRVEDATPLKRCNKYNEIKKQVDLMRMTNTNCKENRNNSNSKNRS